MLDTDIVCFNVQPVKIGDICDGSKVVRVDRGLGLLLEIPSTPVSTPAYVSVCSFCGFDSVTSFAYTVLIIWIMFLFYLLFIALIIDM